MAQGVPFRFQNRAGTLQLAWLDSDLDYISGKWVSVKDAAYGALGDGVTDDTAAIQAAINSGAGVIVFPPGSYRVSSGIAVGAGQYLLGLAYGPNVVNAPAQIVGDLSVTPIVTLNGGGASAGVGITSLGINRAAGSVPANSIGLLVTAANNPVIEDVIVYRCDIGVKLSSTLGTGISRLQTTIISGTHLWIENSQEVHAIACRFGKNGGQDVSGVEYVRIKGNSDTIQFTQGQFNISGATSILRAIYFDTYTSPNGIVGFVQCHFEAPTGITNIISQTGTSVVGRISFINCQLNCSGTLFNTPTAFFTDLIIADCPFITGDMTLDNPINARIHDNHFGGIVLIDATLGTGLAIVHDNVFDNNFGMQGTWTSVNVHNNSFAAGWGNAAIGNVVVNDNTFGVAATRPQVSNFTNGARVMFNTTFASLVALPNGSVFYVTDGTPASSPLTGGGTGCIAVRQNGAWRGL